MPEYMLAYRYEHVKQYLNITHQSLHMAAGQTQRLDSSTEKD